MPDRKIRFDGGFTATGFVFQFTRGDPAVSDDGAPGVIAIV